MAEEEKKDQEITEVDVTQMSDEDLKKEVTQAKTGAGEKVEIIKPEGKVKTEVKTEIPLDEMGKLKKQVDDKEAFIQKQAGEIGTLRKKVREFETPKEDAQERERVKQIFSEDPIAGTEQANLLIETKKGKQKEFIKSLIPNIEEIKSDIADLVREEGSESEENIALFISNPYVADPMKLRYWAAVVNAKKEREGLTKRVEDLETQIKDAGKTVIKKIEAAAKETKTLTAKTGAEHEEEATSITEDQIPYLSDEELKTLTKKTMSKRA